MASVRTQLYNTDNIFCRSEMQMPSTNDNKQRDKTNHFVNCIVIFPRRLCYTSVRNVYKFKFHEKSQATRLKDAKFGRVISIKEFGKQLIPTQQLMRGLLKLRYHSIVSLLILSYAINYVFCFAPMGLRWTKIMTWINNYSHTSVWDAITRPSHNFIGGFIKPPLKLGMDE